MRIRIVLSAIIVMGCSFAMKGRLSILAGDTALNEGVRLIVAPSKKSYILGEPVRLKIEFVNDSDKVISFGNCFDVETGSLKILIGQSRDDFKKYSHSRWGISDKKCVSRSLNPQDKIYTHANILWNFVPDVASIDKLSDEQLATNYAFPENGIYFIKSKYLVNLSGQLVEISSEPVELMIEEPVGEDLAVWNKIKDRGDFAYFMQEGDFLIPSYKPDDRAKMQAEIEQILAEHPNSIYVGTMRQSLGKYTANEEKRKAFQRQIEHRQKPEPPK